MGCILIGFPDVLLFVKKGPQVCQVASNTKLKLADEMQKKWQPPALREFVVEKCHSEDCYLYIKGLFI